MLDALDGYRVVAETSTDTQALELARYWRPHLALIDQELSGYGGWWTINALQREGLADVIVALGRRGEGQSAQLAGAQAYVQVGCAPRELLSALREALQVAV